MSHAPSSTETRHLRTLFAVGAAGMLSDDQLLERFASRKGDTAELAFAALVERHGSMVLRVARGVCLDEHSAHDVFQATFLILARKARSLWVRDSLGPWLHAVAYRVASQGRALELRRKRLEKDASKPEAHQAPHAERADLIRAIHQEIDRLPQPFRLALVTCHLEGLTQQDAADRLGWPVGTLQSRLARGRAKLRERLERRGLTPSLTVLGGSLPTVPHLLTTSTAKAAVSLHLGRVIAGTIAPTVLAMIQTSTQGMLMTKLKLGAAAVVMMVGGIMGTGMAVGVGRPAKATDGPPALVVSADEPTPHQAISKRLLAPPDDVPLDYGDPIPAPAEGLGFPVLLDFHSSGSRPCLQMRPIVTRMVANGYPIKTIDVDFSPSLAGRYKVNAVPTFILVDGSGHELSRLQKRMTAGELARFYNENRPKPPEPEPAVDEPLAPPDAVATLDPVPQPPDELEPALTDLTAPKPWATGVRIKLHISKTEWGFASGTVISSTSEESIILTCGHIFRLMRQTQPAPRDFKVPITVDLFNGQLVGTAPARVGRADQDIVGEAIDYDFDNDLGLIRIRPGRQLPVSPVVPASWHPQKGMKMITVGCSHGADATAWDTTILDPRVRMNNSVTNTTFFEIKCAHQPKEARSGGGLYTTDGQVAGVCNFADPNEHVGLYAVPDAIHRFLDRNWLSSLYEKREGNARAENIDVHGFKHPAPADLLKDAGHEASKSAAAETKTEPPLVEPAAPRPWDTVVRINLPVNGKWTPVGSGTIIKSTPNRTVILTSAHLFGGDRLKLPLGFNQPGRILVDLFDGQFSGWNPASVHASSIDQSGWVIAHDFDRDLALIEIRPGRVLPVSPIKKGLTLTDGMPMIALGCSNGGDATAWNTKVLKAQVRHPGTADNFVWNVIECDYGLKPGRSGGGLFDAEGHLLGVALTDQPATQTSLYARPESIRNFLNKSGFTMFVDQEQTRKDAIEDLSPKAGPAVPVPDDQRRIAELEKKLDQVLKAVEGLKAEKKPE